MHDYHKAKDMIEYAQKKAAEAGKDKISKIYLTFGESSGYSADTILMYFQEESAGTVCEGAEVVVKTIKAELECPACHTVYPRKLLEYQCPSCGTEGQPSKASTVIEITGVEFA